MDNFEVVSITQKKNSAKCSIISELAKHVRVNSVNGISSCLKRLKNDRKSYKEFITQVNGLDILIQLLCHKNHMILNMSLSILADACTARDIREKVKSSNIRSNVISIIKNPIMNGKLHCRACRLISNLSECSWHANKLYDAGVVELLAVLLKSKTDMQTYLMIIRAIRIIWSCHKDSREKMLTKYEIVKLVGQIFVMAVETSKTNIKYVELVDACLKAIYTFLIELDSRCGLQLQIDEHKQGYKCLIQCCNSNFKIKNKMAFKCLYILCQIAECRVSLGTCGIVEQLITIIDSTSSIPDSLSQEILVSLCLFCWEAVNRARITNYNGLQLILKLLKMSEYECYHSMLLHTLMQFYYDEIAINILVEHGIVDILATKLKQMATVAMNNNTSNVSKRHCDYLSNEKTLKYLKQNCGKRYSMDFYQNDWSPRSTSGYSSSAPSTPPLPPYDLNTEADDITDDNIYSPICSDTEYDDKSDEIMDEAISLQSNKSITIETDNSNDSYISNKTDVRNQLSCSTLALLSRLTVHHTPIDGLADSIMIKSLLTYIKYTKNIKASEILIRIMRHATYFIPLLKQGFVFEVQDLSEPEQYMQPLCTIAEMGGSIGELSSILLRDEEKHKLMTAVSIPLLIKTHSILRSLLQNNGGLKLIFRILMEPSHHLFQQAIWSICQLAKTLQIQPEIVINQPITIVIPKKDRLYNLKTMLPTVMFELDDGTTLETCRKTLCQCSDVFYAMLEGHFKESGKKRVRLKDTSFDSLNTFILAISDAPFEHRSIESVLDAMLLADKFLMPDLSDRLVEMSINKLNYENFAYAWCWAKNNFCDELRSCFIKSFLITKMSWSEMMYALHNFRNSNDFNEFLQEVKQIITDLLCQY